MWKFEVKDGGELDWPKDVKMEVDEHIAEQLADYYHTQCDGWESSWPLDLTIIEPSGVRHVFNVDRDFDPVFYAQKTEQEK
jgi:hypothetical protein